MRAAPLTLLILCATHGCAPGGNTKESGRNTDDTADDSWGDVVGDSAETAETAETGDSGAPEADCDLRVPEDHARVEDALLAAVDGQVICVGAGTWTGDLDFAGKEVMLVGAGVGETILLGDGEGAVVRFASGEGPGAGLRALTVTGGMADGGAGVTVLEGASPTLQEVKISWNGCLGVESTVRGVGLYAEGGTFEDVSVQHNVCALDTSGGTKIYGTGAYLRGGALATGLEVASNTGYAYEITGALVAKDLTVPLERVSVHHNEAEANLSCVGGGLHLSGTTSEARSLDLRENRCAAKQVWAAGLHVFVDGAITLERVIVAGNQAEASESVSGGAARLLGEVTLTRADLVGNEIVAPRAEGAVVAFASAGQQWRNVAVWRNTVDAAESSELWASAEAPEIAWSGLGDLSSFAGAMSAPDAADGNLFVDPRYTDVTSENAIDWDLSLAADSPHIDAGDPALLDEDGSRSDIGALGGEGG